MISLTDISPNPPEGCQKEECNIELLAFKKKLFDLQNIFYADHRFSLLVVLQGMDTSGKDGTIRNVMTCMNPMGIRVHSFKKPTEEEKRHDFLWRVYPHIPPKGIIEVFNRSYYEDIIVPKIKNELSEDRLKHRINLVNGLEDHLLHNNIHILKFYLHISSEEQLKRIEERQTKPHKMWKYDEEDIHASKRWNEYASIYEEVFEKCKVVPWKIIPANKRWYRNYLVAKEIKEYLEGLDLRYPR